jgi:hypothetical protein
MTRLKLYTAFHLNLAYSSIEEEQRPQVLRKCYWPLLDIARKLDIPFGIEAPGYTLQAAGAIDPAWISELRRLVGSGRCEFIGSGYSQLIGPIVPPKVNAANLAHGHRVYEELLGLLPQVALVNEQAYSSGLVEHYLKAGYRAIMMDWDNPASRHPEWQAEFRYFPQYACSQDGREIPLIWTNSIAFQEFQRYAHGEMELDEYQSYLSRQMGETDRAFPIYCNDIEIFNFRPGRYETEAAIQEDEWKRIYDLLQALLSDGRYEFVKPSQVLDLIGQPKAGQRLRLESPAQPIPVKKQSKYNITRWAVTGRDDLGINTACWRVYCALADHPAADQDWWRELCYLWSSDFRTHITERRWSEYQRRLRDFEVIVAGGRKTSSLESIVGGEKAQFFSYEQKGRYLSVQTDQTRIKLNCSKGLAVEALYFTDICDQPLCGTLHHGYYEDINWGADYYTGHLILESPGRPKITDLSPVKPHICGYKDHVLIQGTVPTILGPIRKNIILSRGSPRLQIVYQLDWKAISVGSLRLGHLTLNPDVFDRETLQYRTHNGGYGAESFSLAEDEVDLGSAVSFLVSARNGLGMTGGMVELKDASHGIRARADMTSAAPLGLITCKQVGESYFCRLAFSLQEVDETCKHRSDAKSANLIASVSFAPC